MATPFKGATLRSLLNFVSTFEAIPDFDIQRMDMGFCEQFRTVIALAEPTSRGSSAMYGMAKYCAGHFPGIRYAFKTGSCAASLDKGTVAVASPDQNGMVCQDLYHSEEISHAWVSISRPPSSLIQGLSKRLNGVEVTHVLWSGQHHSAREVPL